MKKIITYECEICHGIYDSEKQALDCEAKGIPDLTKIPTGMVFNNAGDKSNFYNNITFIISNPHTEHTPHYAIYSLWAFRDNDHGDSLKLEDICYYPTQYTKYHFNASKADPTHPTFKRAIDFLKKYNINPSIWDGNNVIPYTMD